MINALTVVKETNNFEHMPKLLFAADSGSRSKGYATPFSDLDVFAIYVRHPDDYITITDPKERFFAEAVIAGELAQVQLWDLRDVIKRRGRDTTVFNAMRRTSAITAFVNQIPLAVERDLYGHPVDTIGLIYSNLNWKHTDNTFKGVMQHCYVSMAARYLLDCGTGDACYLMPVNILSLVSITSGVPDGFFSLFSSVLSNGIKNSDESYRELSFMLHQIDAESRTRVLALTRTKSVEDYRDTIFKRSIKRIWK